MYGTNKDAPLLEKARAVVKAWEGENREALGEACIELSDLISEIDAARAELDRVLGPHSVLFRGVPEDDL